MSETFHCPSCHAPLHYKPGDGVLIRCDYCGNSVIVPENLRASEPTAYPAGSSARNLAEQIQRINDLVRAGKKAEAALAYHKQFPSTLPEAQKVIELLAQGQGVSLGKVTVQTTTRPNRSYVTLARTETSSSKQAGYLSWAILFFIVLMSCGPLLIAMSQPGGPLFNVWTRLNPFAFARASLIFGTEGLEEGQFFDLRGVVADPAGNIIASDYQSGRIQVFDATGHFINLWQFDQEAIISNLDLGPNGVVYAIIEGQLHRLTSPAGDDLGQINLPNDNFFYLDDLAVKQNGDIILIGEDTLLYLNHEERLMWSIPGREVIPNFNDFVRVDIDSEGHIYILGATRNFQGSNDVIFKFTADGQYVNQFSGSGEEKGQLDSPYDIALDKQGRIYVGDWNGIEVLDSSGRYLSRIPVNTYPFGIFISDNNELYLTTNNSKIYRYSLP